MKIARTEKIDESKELAEDIQDSLSRRIQKTNKPVKNRGVRKAPFVVLIGADMPSILTEISFLSNPADEQMLKKPEQRQKVAEGLYQGVVGYLESMNSVTMNRPAKPVRGTPARRRLNNLATKTRRLVSNRGWDGNASPHLPVALYCRHGWRTPFVCARCTRASIPRTIWAMERREFPRQDQD